VKHVNRFHTFLLVLSLAMISSVALAQNVIIDGGKRQQNIRIIADTAWTSLLFTEMNLGSTRYDCAVTCTSTVLNPQNDEIYYYAAFNDVALNVKDGCVRPFDFAQGSAAGNRQVVTTACLIRGLLGRQIFNCLGRKAETSEDVVVDNTSMHVICVP
jgi:hypothetical protein